jgi:polyhydroxyalkanoate synthesis regulator phasin
MRTAIILLAIGLLVFAGCDNSQEKTEEPSIIVSIANALKRLEENQEKATDNMASFAKNVTQHILDLEERINDLEQRIKVLEEK